MDAAGLQAALLSARQSWVALPAGGSVRIRRPAEAEFGRFVGGVTVDHVCDFVDGWRDVTEATLLGASVGSEEAADFHPDVWRTWVRDRVDVIEVVARALGDAISAHLAARKAISGN
jgi:hypothetical protein